MPYYFQTLLPILISLTVKGRSSTKSQHYGPKCKSDRTQFLNGNECPHCQLSPLQILRGVLNDTVWYVSHTNSPRGNRLQ